MISGGKSKYQNLLTLIEHEHPRLYTLIEMLLLEGTFATTKYQNTFLIPNEKVITHLEKLVDEDHDREAVDAIRSLLLSEHIVSTNDFKKGADIGTLQFGGKFKLAEPEEVGKLVKDAGKKIVKLDGATVVNYVYKYDGDSVPKTVEGVSKTLTPVVNGKGGGARGITEENMKKVEKVNKKLATGDKKTIVCNFFKAVTAALSMLKAEKDGRFEKAKFYLAANPIVSWYFLTMMGHEKALLTADEVSQLQLIDVDKNLIEEAETAGGYEFNRTLFNEINDLRKKLIEGIDRTSVVSSIERIYNEMFPKMDAAGAAIRDIYRPLKMRMDELRFLCEQDVGSLESVTDAISVLSNVKNYIDPKSMLTLVDEETIKKLSSKEIMSSAWGVFILSPYICYMPMTPEIEHKMQELIKVKCGGSISGGNPATLNTIAFLGGSARDALNKMHKPLNVKAFVDKLSKAQREQLKDML